MLKSTLVKAAQAAGALIQERINGNFSVETKAGPNDLVTEVDKASEALIHRYHPAGFSRPFHPQRRDW
jgi:fructose-1,6-bisphosphatase/inositol monophosphatase family enzyme